MTTPAWQLQIPVSAVVFDCDGTLSAIEGIDELARLNHVGAEVQALTAEAMGKTGINPALYQKRLELVHLKQTQLLTLGEHYFTHQTPDGAALIELLQKLNKTVYLVSAGLDPAVKIFGKLLNIPTENIFAVGVTFNERGDYLDFDRASPLTSNSGKREIITQLKKSHPNLVYVGDGLNDYSVYDLVTRFIGYGGIFYRRNIEELCQYYIRAASLMPVLPLALTRDEVDGLDATQLAFYQQGVTAIQQGKVKV